MKIVQKKKLLFLSTLGSALEYFDFVIYALAVSYLSLHFFPKNTPLLNNLQALLIFATGYIFRPLGGLLFGMFGDKNGRKSSFTASLLIMGAATFFIGILPSYDAIGYLSPLLLFIARSLQGIAQGAEISGAFIFVYEHEDDKKLAAKSISILNSGVGLGALAGSLLFAILASTFSEHEMQIFGWRLPFLMGGGTAFIAYFLRKNSQETPSFLNQKKEAAGYHIKAFFMNYFHKIVSGICLVLFPAVLIINFLFLPNFLTIFYVYDPHVVYILQTFGLAWSAVALPFSGRLAVFLGPKRQMQYALQVSFIVIPFSYYLLSTNHFLGLFSFVFFYQTLIALLASCYAVILTQSFPVQVRYKGTAVAYNLAFALAGFIPYIITKSAFLIGSALVTPVVLMLICLISYLFGIKKIGGNYSGAQLNEQFFL